MLCNICMQPTGSDDHFCKRHRKHLGSDGSKSPARRDFTDRQIADAIEREDGFAVAGSIANYWEKKSQIEAKIEIRERQNSTILPMTLGLSIYGISSIIPGDIFKVDYLPERFNRRLFIIQ